MPSRYSWVLIAVACIGPLAVAADVPEPTKADQPKIAASRVVAVTVYPSNALITREVTVPEGVGLHELVVNPLPARTVNSSLYSEGTEGIRVLTTRYRMRPIKEDTREEVRKAEALIRQLLQAGQKMNSEVGVIQQNVAMLGKLETFTGATLQQLTEKGLLNADTIILLSKYVMDSRAEKSTALVNLQQQLADNQEQLEFSRRKLRDLTAGSSKIERDAIIVVDKKEAAGGKVRLHYLVDAASWHPQYKFRAVKDKDSVQLEYLAAIVQQSGEDWSNVNIILSTAQPMLNAAPPDLKVLEVSVMPRTVVATAPGPQGQPGQSAAGGFGYQSSVQLGKQAQILRQNAQQELNVKKGESGNKLYNDAAALEQTRELLVQLDDIKKEMQLARASGDIGEGPSVTYHLNTQLTIPSRNDEQVIEVAKIDMKPDYYYKAVPVLTQHVYRLATLTNRSTYVLLPGEATMYIGSDFVGRADLPLVAVGEQFTAGFGVDPQVQVQRQMLDKTRTTQGDNQVHRFEYRILVSSYKTEPVKLQLWDRLPHGESESVGVSLVKTEPKLSTDAIYLRETRPQNLLRWDLTVAPTMNGEKALAINYEFKLEIGRQMTIHSLSVNKDQTGIPLPSMVRPAPAAPAPTTNAPPRPPSPNP